MRGLGPARCTPGTASLDVLVHGWDLAMATGQDYTLDPDLMEARRRVIEPQLAAFRSSSETVQVRVLCARWPSGSRSCVRWEVLPVRLCAR